MEMREQVDRWLDEHKDEMTDTLKRLVSIRSIEEKGGATPFGEGVTACLNEALKISEEMGFATHNMENYCGYAEVGDAEDMVMILGHLDVVPEGSGWDSDPYKPEIRNGRLYGRGTCDDKGPVVAGMFALKALMECGVPLNKRVRVLFGCNEETGSEDLKYYHAHGGEAPVMGYTPDAEYPLINGEKGIAIETFERAMKQSGDWKILELTGGEAANIIPASAACVLRCPAGALERWPEAEKIHVTLPDSADADGMLEVRVEAEGKAAHGSMPELGENAIGRLMLYLKELPFTGDAADVIAFVADHIGMKYNGEGLGCELEDEISGKLVNNMGVMSGDETKIRLTLNYRYPVTYTLEDCRPAILSCFEQEGWKSVSLREEPSLYMPEDSELVQKLLKVYRERTGDMSAPKAIGGGTYAKSMPNTLAFGICFPGDEMSEHLPNEYIDLNRMLEAAKIQAMAIYELAK